jgi:hypothetical protein
VLSRQLYTGTCSAEVSWRSRQPTNWWHHSRSEGNRNICACSNISPRLFIYHACVHPFSILGFSICPSTLANCKFGRTTVNNLSKIKLRTTLTVRFCYLVVYMSLSRLTHHCMCCYQRRSMRKCRTAPITTTIVHPVLEDLLECSNTLGFLKGPPEGRSFGRGLERTTPAINKVFPSNDFQFRYPHALH